VDSCNYLISLTAWMITDSNYFPVYTLQLNCTHIYPLITRLLVELEHADCGCSFYACFFDIFFTDQVYNDILLRTYELFCTSCVLTFYDQLCFIIQVIKLKSLINCSFIVWPRPLASGKLWANFERSLLIEYKTLCELYFYIFTLYMKCSSSANTTNININNSRALQYFV